MSKKLLLISNSICYGKGYLDHCAEEIVDYLGEIKDILFVPYALHDRDWYANLARERFNKMGIKLTSIHRARNPENKVKKGSSIFVGGGNTFRLLSELYRNGLIKIIQKKVNGGMPYIGASAGANVACPTMKTTNDMPIVCPPSFDSLNLVKFNINPHYIDSDPNTKHMGETRDKRIEEFHEEDSTVVVGLREGSYIRIENKNAKLKGKTGAKIFTKNKKPKEYKANSNLKFLLT